MLEPPLLEVQCSCGHEAECAQVGINMETIKGLMYLMGSQKGKDFALMMANRKLKRNGSDLQKFTTFVDKIKDQCPYYLCD